MTRLVFGSDNAETDPLLDDCYVAPPGLETSRPILTGRWGTGKSALLLYGNRDLTKVLAAVKADERLWYLDERTLDLQGLIQLKKDLANDEQALKRAIEDVWRAEIVRVECALLARLWQYYGSPGGEHWSFVADFGEELALPLWRRLPEITKLIFSTGPERTNAARMARNSIVGFFTDKALVHVQNCLTDIKHQAVQPVIGIEPIETPSSALEEHSGLAQAIVTAVLNVFRSTFEPSDRQRIAVRLSVPWHRFRKDEVDFPQKLFQYIGHVWWDEKTLREFINKRIEWEFRRVHRSFVAKGNLDAWAALFAEPVRNDHCRSGVKEDTFRYFVRHTHYRARDLQRLAREAVTIQAGGEGGDDVLTGKGGRKVTETAIRETMRRICRDVADERITEARRRYPDIVGVVDAMRGIRVPFDRAGLKKRLDQHSNQPLPWSELVGWVEKLWAAGFIGVEVTPKTDEARRQLTTAHGEALARRYEIDGRDVTKWFFFEYSWEGEVAELLDRYEQSEGVDADTNLVLHPMTFEYLQPRVTQDYPIGA